MFNHTFKLAFLLVLTEIFTPVALRMLVTSVMLSEDFLSPMMTTTPGTIGLRPAASVRRYCVVKVTASPAEGDTQIYTKKNKTQQGGKLFPNTEVSLRFDLCYFQGFHQTVLTESFVEVYQIRRGY